MKFDTKIWILITLFGVKALLHLIDGINAFSTGASYGAYGDAFVTSAIMAYIAYVLYSTRNKWTYWIAVFFAGLVLVRFLMAMGLMLYSSTELSAGLATFAVLNGVVFGLVPLLLLAGKDVRSAFNSAR